MNRAVFLSDEIMAQKWKRIYDEHRFPFEVRFHLDEWINKIAWGEIRQDRNVAKYSQDLIVQLYLEIQKTAKDPQLGPLDKVNLMSAKNKIQEQFNNQPVDLIDVVQNCLNQERLLLDSSKVDHGDRRPTEEDIELLHYKKLEEKLKSDADQLRISSQNTESMLEHFHTSLDQSIPKFSDLQDAVRENKEKQASIPENVQQTQMIQRKIADAISQMQKMSQSLTLQKDNLAEAVYRGCKKTVDILRQCWQAIDHYRLQQKKSVAFLAKTPDGAVDILNKMCEIGGQFLMSFLGFLEMSISDMNRIEFQDDTTKRKFIQLQTEMGIILEKHINTIFVITRQPQNVVKIVQNKSPQLHMCVRLLGGASLGIGHTVPLVTVRVYTEQKLKIAMEVTEPSVPGMCKTVENGTGVPMQLKKPKDHILANLNNMVLRGVERFEKKDKDERVTDYKYGVICYTKVIIRNKEYPLKVLALPVVFTSQTSQEGPAKGTLMWDAFSPLERQLYEDPPHVKWELIEQVLKGMFKETGLGLNSSQLDYIRRYIFGKGLPLTQQENQSILTKERFLRDKVRGCDFTYWMWLYACKNLVMECVQSEWKDKMIYGFIGRLEAESLLKDKEPGTFLLRFRERKIEGSQKANKCAYLAIAVVGCHVHTGEKVVDHVKDYLTPSDIHKYGLTCILKSMVDVQTREPLLNTLYPDVDFAELTQKYLPDNGDSSEGYSRTEFMIRVMNGRTPDGSDCPLSPISTVSNTLSVSSPGVPDTWTSLELDPRTVDLFETSPFSSSPFGHEGMINTCDQQLSTINFNDLLHTQDLASPRPQITGLMLVDLDAASASTNNLNLTSMPE